MAVVWTKLKRSRQFRIDSSRKMTGQKVYLVLCDDKVNDTPDVALTGVPVIGASWSEEEPDLKVTGQDAKEASDVPPDGATLYEVTIDFGGTQADDGGGGGGGDPPPDIPENLEVSFGFATSTEEATLAKEAPTKLILANGTEEALSGASAWKWGKGIVNTAGIKFNPGLEKTYYDRQIMVDWDSRTFPFDESGEYIDSINDDDFTIVYRGQSFSFESEKVRIADFGGRPQIKDGIESWRCHIELQERKDGWERKVLNAGLTEIAETDGDNFKRRPILDKDGEPVMEPCLLDGEGKEVTGSAPIARFIPFLLNDKKGFTSAGLPGGGGS